MNQSTLSTQSYANLTYKVVIIGDKAVGKTSIVKRYIEKAFSVVTESTIGAQFFSNVITISPQTQGGQGSQSKVEVKLQIWDTAGEEKFRSLTPMYYKNAAAVILVYDSTNEDTFHSIGKWVKEIDEHRTTQVIVFLVANKCDMSQQEEVSLKTGMEYAKKIKASNFIQTSAKENIGIDDLFYTIAERLYFKAITEQRNEEEE